MSSSIAACRWVLAFSCIELFASSVLAAPPSDPEALRRSLELEVALAEKPELYVLAEGGVAELQIKVRGLILHRMSLDGLAIVRVPSGGDTPAPLQLPHHWVVEQTARGRYRKKLIPEVGRSEQLAESEAGEQFAPPRDESMEFEVAAPASYRVVLSDGWELVVRQRVDAPSWWERFRLSLSTWGSGPARSEVRFGLAPDDARRLFRTLRSGTHLLVIP